MVRHFVQFVELLKQVTQLASHSEQSGFEAVVTFLYCPDKQSTTHVFTNTDLNVPTAQL
jgi:hypothetical protein